jgi:nucleoside-diphosphate-sugar epimerase
VKLGAQVTIVDTLNPRYGGNWFNIDGVRDKLTPVIGDIRDEKLMTGLVQGKDVIFNLAAQVSYIDSSSIPFEDLDVNGRGQLVLLEACREHNRKACVVFSSSRLVLGKIIEDPVTELHPTNPLSLYGAHKLVAEKYHFMYFKDYGIPTVVLRLTNPYGDRQQMKHSKYSMPGWFMRLAMEGKEISVFGDGTQIRDYVYVADVVDAFLRAGVTEDAHGKTFNCGSGTSYRFKDMVTAVVDTVGKGAIRYVPWPENYERVETGDFRTDISQLSTVTGWHPSVPLTEGIRRMFEYYTAHRAHYLF